MNKYTWDVDPENKMSVVVKLNGTVVIHFFLGEAMECAGRKNILNHVKECDNSSWLKEWQAERSDVIIDVIKGNQTV